MLFLGGTSGVKQSSSLESPADGQFIMHRPRSLERLDSLEGLRSVAFFLILMSHCGSKWAGLGGPGVSIFFILSGFLMSYSYLWRNRLPEKESVGDYIKFGIRKISRLYPLHIIVLITGIYISRKTVFGPSAYKLLTGTAKFVLDAALVQAWFPKSSIYFALHGPAWYLSASLFLYTCFPYIASRLEKDTTGAITRLLPIVIWITQLIIAWLLRDIHLVEGFSDDLHKYVTYIFPVYRLGDFTIGCCIGSLYIRRRNKRNQGDKPESGILTGSIIEFLTLSILLISIFIKYKGGYIPIFNGGNWWRFTTLSTIPSCLSIWVFSWQKGLFSKALASKPLVLIGSLSAFGFLLHVRVIWLLKKVFGYVFSTDYANTPILIISALLCTLVACIIWKCIFDTVEKRQTIDQNV